MALDVSRLEQYIQSFDTTSCWGKMEEKVYDDDEDESENGKQQDLTTKRLKLSSCYNVLVQRIIWMQLYMVRVIITCIICNILQMECFCSSMTEEKFFS